MLRDFSFQRNTDLFKLNTGLNPAITINTASVTPAAEEETFSPEEIYKRLAQGDLTALEELDKNKISYTQTKNASGGTVITYTYNGKEYIVTCYAESEEDAGDSAAPTLLTTAASVFPTMDLGIRTPFLNSGLPHVTLSLPAGSETVPVTEPKIVPQSEPVTQNTANGVNGEIDEAVYQGTTGNCQVIADILALAATEMGREILKKIITVNDDGSVTVSLRDGNYTITAEEIAAAEKDKQYSSGDNDMLVLELALQKCLNRSTNPEKESILHQICYNFESTCGEENMTYLYANQDHLAITFSLSGDNVEHSATCTDGTTFTYSRDSGHAFAVTKITEDTITFVNPWDSTTEYTMTWEEFKKLGGDIRFADLKTAYAAEATEEPATTEIDSSEVVAQDKTSYKLAELSYFSDEEIDEYFNCSDSNRYNKNKADYTLKDGIVIDGKAITTVDELKDALKTWRWKRIDEAFATYTNRTALNDAGYWDVPYYTDTQSRFLINQDETYLQSLMEDGTFTEDDLSFLRSLPDDLFTNADYIELWQELLDTLDVESIRKLMLYFEPGDSSVGRVENPIDMTSEVSYDENGNRCESTTIYVMGIKYKDIDESNCKTFEDIIEEGTVTIDKQNIYTKNNKGIGKDYQQENRIAQIDDYAMRLKERYPEVYEIVKDLLSQSREAAVYGNETYDFRLLTGNAMAEIYDMLLSATGNNGMEGVNKLLDSLGVNDCADILDVIDYLLGENDLKKNYFETTKIKPEVIGAESWNLGSLESDETLQQVIEEMGLVKAEEKGCYIKKDSPWHIVYYIWNPSTKEMVEYKEFDATQTTRVEHGSEKIYRDYTGITANYNNREYQELLAAYKGGYNFTTVDGVYEKNGVYYKYKYNYYLETGSFEKYEIE